MSDVGASQPRSYWVVSPNVRYNERTVSDWRQASVRAEAAFMGWPLNDKLDTKRSGDKFAEAIRPGDVILIARRHKNHPEIVGFGVVEGKYQTQTRGVGTPEPFGSLRNLSPFVPWSKAPVGIPLLVALPRNLSLAKLHPDRNKTHATVCRWMDRQIGARSSVGNRTPHTSLHDIRLARMGSFQLDYEVRTKGQIRRAEKVEAQLVQQYDRWLTCQGRHLSVARYKNLQCDGFEVARRNLIEAKSSTRREYIRMAVGQLLDYEFQGRKEFGRQHIAVLVPVKPDSDVQAWLTSLHISIIWRGSEKFFDNANGQFT